MYSHIYPANTHTEALLHIGSLALQVSILTIYWLVLVFSLGMQAPLAANRTSVHKGDFPSNIHMKLTSQRGEVARLQLVHHQRQGCEVLFCDCKRVAY
jgi:hypothetical protein